MKVVSAIILLLLLSTFSTSLTITKNSYETINIDCSNINGTIKYFSDINCGPLPARIGGNGKILTEEYKSIGINFIRTHDFYGPTDISTIFPNWSADVNDASSYNFTLSDKVISSIASHGFNVFYRLGESASDDEKLRQPPDNFTKWAEICRHVVMHYNDGWDNGYHYNITYWEIWNEPDLNGFWNGTPEQYYELYKITSITLKNYNSSLKIGGPCTSSITNENFTTGFLDYIMKNNVPLDFYSWHLYSSSPYELRNAALYIRNLLDGYGLKECENINTEWNVLILSPQRDKDNAKNAAFTASTMIAWQDAGISHAFRYRGTQDKSWLARLLGFDLSLFTYEGMYKRPALSYLAMKHLSEETPLMLGFQFNVSGGISYIAGISADKSNISIMISNYEAMSRVVRINLSRIPDNNSRMAHYIIDEGHHFEVVEERKINSSNFTISLNLNKNSVHFIRITSSQTLPEEGPEVAGIPLWMKLHFLDPFIKLLGILILSIVFG